MKGITKRNLAPLRGVPGWALGRKPGGGFAVLLALFCLGEAMPGWGQTAATNQVTPEMLQQVLSRLAQAEGEIKALKAELAARPVGSVATNMTAAVAAPDPAWQQRLVKDEAELTKLRSELDARDAVDLKPKYPNLQFHGFGDIDWTADTRKSGRIPYGVSTYGGRNTFFLGALDLYLSSQLAENLSIVNETALGAGLDNKMEIDIERLYLEYRANDYFNLDLGRFHTALGYYSTTYHHGNWLETAVGRPTFLQFEDSGGILPVHMVGLSIHGAVPSGKLNLDYFVEVGNGLHFSSDPNNEAVQQITSFSDSKAVNVALTARPEGLPGFQFGSGVYYDLITPDLTSQTSGITSLPRNNQLIFNSHVVYRNALWEMMAEGYLIQDRPQVGSAHYSPAFFTQLSRKFGLLTPYARFTYYNVSRNDLLYTLAWAGGVNAGVHYGPSLGLRYDFSDFAAFKVQYDFLHDSGLNDASRITLQACFTF